jgi:hypothetical protein
MADENLSRPVTPDEVPTGNPLEGLDVNVLVPTIVVRMVNADVLGEYEIWFGFASLLATASVAFLVAYIQSFQKDIHGVEHDDPTLLVVGIVFFVFFLLAGGRAVVERLKIRRESKSYPMRLTGGES